MASWREVEAEAPELSALARGYLGANKHLALAALRKDGSPRISGVEIEVTRGEVWVGSMPGGVKARDLQRDPRYAVHSGASDPDAGWAGDAKLAGRAEEVHDEALKREIAGEGAPPGPFHLFRCDIAELVVVRLGEPADHLLIESWHEGRGLSCLRR